jgi:hypothetical protein
MDVAQVTSPTVQYMGSSVVICCTSRHCLPGCLISFDSHGTRGCLVHMCLLTHTSDPLHTLIAMTVSTYSLVQPDADNWP